MLRCRSSRLRSVCIIWASRVLICAKIWHDANEALQTSWENRPRRREAVVQCVSKCIIIRYLIKKIKVPWIIQSCSKNLHFRSKIPNNDHIASENVNTWLLLSVTECRLFFQTGKRHSQVLDYAISACVQAHRLWYWRENKVIKKGNLKHYPSSEKEARHAKPLSPGQAHWAGLQQNGFD